MEELLKKQETAITEIPDMSITGKPTSIGEVLTKLGENPEKPGLGLSKKIKESKIKEESSQESKETENLS